MDAKDKERLVLMRGVTDALRIPDFRHVFSACVSDGPVPILVALPSDTVGDLFAEHERNGTSSAIVVPIADAHLAILQMHQIVGQGADRDEDCPVHRDSEIGMLVEYLRRKPGHQRVRLIKPDCEMELVRVVRVSFRGLRKYGLRMEPQ